MAEQRKPAIALYGVGQYGLEVARIAISKGFPIVAAYNRAGEKVGRDVGALAGIGRDLGVVVQDAELADYTGSGADIAVVTVSDSLRRNMPAYERLLGNGINVICHGTESYYPFGLDPENAARIDAIAKQNGVTYTGSGIWDVSRIWSGILAASASTRIDGLFHKSITDAERIGLKLMKLCGVGMSQDEFAQKMGQKDGKPTGLYMTIPHQVLDALGYTVTDVTEHREPVLWDEPIHCRLLERDIPPGEAAGIRMVAVAHTKEGVTARAEIELRVFREGEVENMLWRVDGRPGTKLVFERDDSVHFSAASLFNRIPDVIAAPPGVQPIRTLGMMRHSALVG
ncbi:MAG: hypothetical protein AB7E60_07065 [Sphingobium sp.]